MPVRGMLVAIEYVDVGAAKPERSVETEIMVLRGKKEKIRGRV